MSDQIDFEAIGGRVMHELHRRLASPELAQDLPGTLLMKVAMDYVKHLEHRNEIEQAKLEEKSADPLEVVVQEGLPFEMRFEILTEFLDEVEEVWRRGSAIIEKMLEEVGNGELVQDVQGMVPDNGGLPDVRLPDQTEPGPADGEAEQPPVPADGESDDGEGSGDTPLGERHQGGA